MNIENILKTGLAEGLNTLFSLQVKPEEIILQTTKKEFAGTFTFTTFAFTKQTKVSPEETGKQLGEYLKANSPEVSDYNVVKGFLNLVISETAWAKLFQKTLSKENFGQYVPNGKKVMVEYSSPNTNKPLHLGHLRNNFLGFSVAEILKAHGYEVIKANLINDRGIHICKSMLAYQKFGNGETPESSGLKGDHLVGKYYVEYDKRARQEKDFLTDELFNEFIKLNNFDLDSQVSELISQEELTHGITKITKFFVDIYIRHYESQSINLADIINIYEKQLISEFFVGYKRGKKMIDVVTDLREIYPLRVYLSLMLQGWESGDKDIIDLWKKMNGWVYDGFNATYKKIGVDFDKFYYESNTYLLGKEIVEEGLNKKAFFKKDTGAVWVDLTPDGLDEKLLLRADGTSVYITQDLGTAELKYKEFGCDKSIYVVGNEQDYHFNVLKLILKKLEKPYAGGVYHLSYGMVDLPSGKMKSREGTVVDADDLVSEMISDAKTETLKHGKAEAFTEEEANILFHKLGLGALKYYLLRVDPKKRMMFNPEESIQLNGDTGPYIQYTHARCRSVIRKMNEHKVDYSEAAYKDFTALLPAEADLVIELNRYPAVVAEAANLYSPSIIAQYCIDLARTFNSFYVAVPKIIEEEDLAAKAFRAAITDTTSKVIKKAMKLLGVEVPEKM